MESGRLDAVPVQVSCYAGIRADQSPRSFSAQGALYRVERIVKEWLEEGAGGKDRRRVFRVVCTDRSAFDLVHRLDDDIWVAHTRTR